MAYVTVPKDLTHVKSSYFSKDKDMLGAEKTYAKLEQKLQRYLDTYEATHNYDAEKVNGVWEQRLRIHYNCVGTIEIPSALPLPTPDVSVNTRKGVVVNYAPCDVAI